jgi:signal transduction histidine kinase
MALLPAFGVFFRVAEAEAFDPIIVRALMAAGCLAMFKWSRSRWVEERVGTLLMGCVTVVLAWSVWIASANDYSANYALGLFAVFVTGAMLLSMGYAGTLPLIIYLCVGIVGSVSTLLADATPAIDAAIFTSCLLVVAVMHYVVVSSRAHLQEALEEREAQLAEAQQTAGLGSWTWTPDTGRVTWSAEMYRLLSTDPDITTPAMEALTRRAHEDDRPGLVRYWADLFAGRDPEDQVVRIIKPDGGVRALRLQGSVVRSAGRTRLTGVCLDVTPEIERALALVSAKELADRARQDAERALHEAEGARREAESARADAEAARAQAEEMARLKSAFLANMSHEIRTPLTAIIGYAQVLGEEVDEDQRGLVRPIEHGGRRLLDTLNSVLDLARLQAGRFDLRMEAVDLAEEAHALGDLLRPLAHAQGLGLVVHAPPSGLVAYADRSALQRVLTNLVSNAVKFTDAGRITLSAEADDEHVHIKVRDTGRGIGPAFLPKLFEEFRQESDGLTRSHEGSGLGLAITRHLVQLMDGAIAVESELGKGSVFIVTLARLPDVVPSPPDSPPNRAGQVHLASDGRPNKHHARSEPLRAEGQREGNSGNGRPIVQSRDATT